MAVVPLLLKSKPPSKRQKGFSYLFFDRASVTHPEKGFETVLQSPPGSFFFAKA